MKNDVSPNTEENEHKSQTKNSASSDRKEEKVFVSPNNRWIYELYVHFRILH